jgi:hypothetical protein
MSDTKQATCADRIAEELQKLEQQVAAVFAAYEVDVDADDYQNNIEVYGVRRTETVQLQLSGGGPADYVEIELSSGEVTGVYYRFSDWFDTARVEVSEFSPVYEWAIQQLEWARYE